jgi:3',5'-cyclic AMP phosphodiesterase CpdA
MRGVRTARTAPVAFLCFLAFSLSLLPACSTDGDVRRQPEIITDAASQPPLSDNAALRFAVIGDSGRWSKQQQELARQLIAQREKFPYEFVLMLGDNNYGDGSPKSYRLRFEEPYKPLLDAGVKFYAVLGNHDAGPQWNYAPFNMGGHRYYTFERKKGVPLLGDAIRFFALDSTNLDSDQIAWFDREISGSNADWKIVLLHHPLYSSGRYSWSSVLIRRTLEPIMVKNGVDIVLSGHEHLYERMVPQNGIVYFTSGAAGSVRAGDLRSSAITAKGYDRDLSFLLTQISGETLYFQAVNRVGETLDSGRITKTRGETDRKLAPTLGAPSPETRQPTAGHPETPRP